MDIVLYLCQFFKSHNHECFVVGGAVRDGLLGKKANDVDLATSASVDEMIELFKNTQFTVVPTGLKHGTLTLVYEGKHFELSSFRGTNLIEDSSKRDFTINAIYYDPFTRKYFDPQKGQDDLARKLIRFTLSAEQRIAEDPLRALRLFRFMSTLNFKAEENSLLLALNSLDDCLKKVSVERVREEFVKLLGGEALEQVLGPFPELFTKICPKASYNQSLVLLPKEKPLLRFAALFDERPDKRMEELKFSHKEIKYVSFLVSELSLVKIETSLKETRLLIRRAQALFSTEARSILQDLVLLASSKGCESQLLNTELNLLEWNYESPLTGEELKELLDLKEGRSIGELKDYLVECVVLGEMSQSDKGRAFFAAQEYLKKKSKC